MSKDKEADLQTKLRLIRNYGYLKLMQQSKRPMSRPRLNQSDSPACHELSPVTCLDDEEHSLLEEKPTPAYSAHTVQRSFLAWNHLGQVNNFRAVCDYYHELEKLEATLPPEVRKKNLEMDYDLLVNPPPTSEYLEENFPNLYPKPPPTFSKPSKGHHGNTNQQKHFNLPSNITPQAFFNKFREVLDQKKPNYYVNQNGSFDFNMPSSVGNFLGLSNQSPSAVNQMPSTSSHFPSWFPQTPSSMNHLPAWLSQPPAQLRHTPTALYNMPSSSNYKPTAIGRSPAVVSQMSSASQVPAKSNVGNRVFNNNYQQFPNTNTDSTALKIALGMLSELNFSQETKPGINNSSPSTELKAALGILPGNSHSNDIPNSTAGRICNSIDIPVLNASGASNSNALNSNAVACSSKNTSNDVSGKSDANYNLNAPNLPNSSKILKVKDIAASEQGKSVIQSPERSPIQVKGKTGVRILQRDISPASSNDGDADSFTKL